MNLPRFNPTENLRINHYSLSKIMNTAAANKAKEKEAELAKQKQA